MTTYTRRLSIPIPDFAVKPWHSTLAEAIDLIDAAIYHALLVQDTDVWDNSIEYEIGEFAIDEDDGQFYVCLVEHTSASTGTFSADRTANPTYWGTVTSQPESQGEWVTATNYLNGNFVVHEDIFYVCSISHTSGVFATDLAAGKWTELADLSGYTQQTNVLEAQVFS